MLPPRPAEDGEAVAELRIEADSPVYLFRYSRTRLSAEHRLIPTKRVMLLGLVKFVFVHRAP